MSNAIRFKALLSSELFDYKMLRYQWMQLRKMIYGRRSEKHYITAPPTGDKDASTQGKLFDVAADHQGITPLKNARKIKERIVVAVKNENPAPHPGRHELPEHLMRCVIKIIGYDSLPKDLKRYAVAKDHHL